MNRTWMLSESEQNPFSEEFLMAEVMVAVGILTGLGVTFGTILAIANIKLHVEEDPRLDMVEELLPGTNCGACGSPGCRAFSEELVEGAKLPSQCTVSPPDRIDQIASFLGVDAGTIEKRVARLLCAGGKAEALDRAEYEGFQNCRAATVVTGGNKGCSWGCLGLADCEVACEFDAISMNPNGLPVVEESLCTACGDCVTACPKDLFMILPLSYKLVVQCKSLLEGEDATDLCSVACTGCGLCVADAPAGLMKMDRNLPLIDYSQNDQLTAEVTSRCPTGAIRWIEGGQFLPVPKENESLGGVEVPWIDEEAS